jgi:hypothetical protein
MRSPIVVRVSVAGGRLSCDVVCPCDCVDIAIPRCSEPWNVDETKEKKESSKRRSPSADAIERRVSPRRDPTPAERDAPENTPDRDPGRSAREIAYRTASMRWTHDIATDTARRVRSFRTSNSFIHLSANLFLYVSSYCYYMVPSPSACSHRLPMACVH